MQISYIVCFNLELTWFTPERRLKVYKTEVLKVMMTMVYFNFMALIFMSWMWDLSKTIKQMVKDRERNAKEQRIQYDQQV